jgi:hypothetical protein
MYCSYVLPIFPKTRTSLTLVTVVRDAKKLTTMLETGHAVDADLISQHLTIVVGNVKDPVVVTETLFPALLNPSNPTGGNRTVDIIVSGIGCYPVQKKGYLFPQQEDPTLCEDALTTILNALRARSPIVKPGLVVLSTTGISKYGRDVPLLFWPLYRFLHVAHEDKKIMERLAIEAATTEPAVTGSYYVVRSSILTNGAAKGVENVRWDVEDGALIKKAIGYTISRADVGGFVFEKVVKPFESGKEEGTGKIFTITH